MTACPSLTIQYGSASRPCLIKLPDVFIEGIDDFNEEIKAANYNFGDDLINNLDKKLTPAICRLYIFKDQ